MRRAPPRRRLPLARLALAGAIASWLGFAARGCVEEDRCLDAGGRWDETAGTCDGARSGG